MATERKPAGASRPKCLICGIRRHEESDFCTLHKVACENLSRAYGLWNEAFSSAIPWDKYLENLIGLPETGHAVRQVAEYLRDKRGQ
ncbi:MAG: hypothetical protein V1857_04920 [archaeon]